MYPWSYDGKTRKPADGIGNMCSSTRREMHGWEKVCTRIRMGRDYLSRQWDGNSRDWVHSRNGNGRNWAVSASRDSRHPTCIRNQNGNTTSNGGIEEVEKRRRCGSGNRGRKRNTIRFPVHVPFPPRRCFPVPSFTTAPLSNILHSRCWAYLLSGCRHALDYCAGTIDA